MSAKSLDDRRKALEEEFFKRENERLRVALHDKLMETGIQPHIIACRASNPVTKNVREKIAMFSNVPMGREEFAPNEGARFVQYR